MRLRYARQRKDPLLIGTPIAIINPQKEIEKIPKRLRRLLERNLPLLMRRKISHLYDELQPIPRLMIHQIAEIRLMQERLQIRLPWDLDPLHLINPLHRKLQRLARKERRERRMRAAKPLRLLRRLRKHTVSRILL